MLHIQEQEQLHLVLMPHSKNMNTMKNKNIISKRLLVGTLSISLLFAACTDLETDEKDSLVIKTAGGTFAGDAKALLASTYSDLGALTDQANVYALSEQPTDEMIPPTRGVDWGDNGVWRTLHQHTWDPTHQQVLDSWNQLNQRAFKCNQILASTSPAPNATEVAEAKFLRAFFMSQVMDLYGQVPFREVNEGVDVDPRVFTRSEAFDFIVADLEAALPALPVTGPSPDIKKNGVASRAAANFLLAKLYLNKGVYKAGSAEGPYSFEKADMDKVIAHVNAIEDDLYSLEPFYFDNFTTKDPKTELIFISPAGSAQNRIYMTLHYNQNPSGWNGFATLADFYGKFESADDRRSASSPVGDKGANYHGLQRGFLVGLQLNDKEEPIIDNRTQLPLSFTPDVPLSGAATFKGIRVIKYHPGDQGPYIFFRYADAYLMKAEAIFRGGSGTGGETALSILNDLRSVRGATALAAVTESAILDERGRELYWEGVRRTDQIRFGTFTTAWHEKTSVETFRVLYPIPQQAIDSNPNLKQNKGYPGYVGE
jgi:hypothetical protein